MLKPTWQRQQKRLVRFMMAWQRGALLLLFSMIGGGSAAGEPAFVPPLENPPNYRQIVQALMRAAPPKDAKPDKAPKTKFAAAPETKPNANKNLVDRFENTGRVTRISPGYSWEISKPRRVEVVPGWSWQVCLKGNRSGKPFYLALFIQNRDVVDARTVVVIDRCESEAYEPL